MSTPIQCPNCGHLFDAEEALSGKVEAHFKQEYERRREELAENYRTEREKLQAQSQKLEAEREQLKRQQEEQRDLINKALEEKKQAWEAQQKAALEEEKKKWVSEAQSAQNERIKLLEEENARKQSENLALKQKELEMLKKQQELRDKEAELQLQVQKQLLEGERAIEEKIRQQENEKFLLKEKEWAIKLEAQRKLAEEMQRKSEQGSMQLQGEVQELALEEVLQRQFPYDRIEEVPKGIRGADCLQVVYNTRQQMCGSIVYESKRTKHFAGDWIAKLKQDQVACKADIAVIVTETLPSDMLRFGQREGVWICGFHEVGSLVLALREALIRTQDVRQSQENQGGKMELLYRYLTGNEFRQTVERIAENYKSMTEQLEAEKRSMQRIWSQREKQIWSVQENLVSLFGSIQGIAGKELPGIPLFELGPGTEV
ncbi:DUF2130 domain-containing protein [bacterium]|nr:DUF2130 domain-containing protein [bacterium]